MSYSLSLSPSLSLSLPLALSRSLNFCVFDDRICGKSWFTWTCWFLRARWYCGRAGCTGPVRGSWSRGAAWNYGATGPAGTWVTGSSWRTRRTRRTGASRRACTRRCQRGPWLQRRPGDAWRKRAQRCSGQSSCAWPQRQQFWLQLGLPPQVWPLPLLGLICKDPFPIFFQLSRTLLWQHRSSAARFLSSAARTQRGGGSVCHTLRVLSRRKGVLQRQMNKLAYMTFWH